MSNYYFNKTTPIIILLLILSVGCNIRNGSEEIDSNEFIMKTLYLEQRKPEGALNWTLNSPEAQYDVDLQLVVAKEPTAFIYVDNIPNYKITADTIRIIR